MRNFVTTMNWLVYFSESTVWIYLIYVYIFLKPDMFAKALQYILAHGSS